MEIREIQKVVSKEGKTAQRLQENGRYSIIRYKKVKARKTMIDIHCHLLYGVDDGAKTIEESVAMLEAAKEQGISAMILTPHYRHGMFAYPKEEIEEHFRILEPYAQKLGIYLALGTEYHVNSHIVEALDSGRCRTMAGSRYVLCEYSHDSEYAYIYQMTQELVLHGYIPVFSHMIGTVFYSMTVRCNRIHTFCLQHLFTVFLWTHTLKSEHRIRIHRNPCPKIAQLLCQLQICKCSIPFHMCKYRNISVPIIWENAMS